MHRNSRSFSSRTFLRALGVAALTVLSATAQAQTYTLTDLGTLGGSQSFATDVNNSGQVVGNSLTSDGSPHGFLYNPGGSLKDLGTQVTYIDEYTGETATATGTDSYASAINNKGQIAGYIDGSSTGGIGFVSTPNGGTLNELHNDDGKIAVDINDKGQVVGSGYGTSSIFNPDGTSISLDFYGSVVALNNNGQILFEKAQSEGGLYNLADGTSSYTAALGGIHWTFFQVNDNGQVVGGSQDDNFRGEYHAYLTLANGKGPAIDLGTLDPNPNGFGPNSEAHGLNNKDQVVGASGTASNYNFNRAFLWENGVMTDLNSLIAPGSGFTLTDATAISDTGYIVGNGTDAFGHDHAFLLSPAAVPEASTTVSFGLLLALGAGAMAIRRRKVSA